MLDEIERRNQLPGVMHCIEYAQSHGTNVEVPPLLWVQWKTLCSRPEYSLSAMPFPGAYGLSTAFQRNHKFMEIWEKEHQYHVLETPNSKEEKEEEIIEEIPQRPSLLREVAGLRLV